MNTNGRRTAIGLDKFGHPCPISWTKTGISLAAGRSIHNGNNSMDSCLLQIPPATARYVRFGPLQIDQHRQRVVRDGGELRLQRKTFEVLIALLQKQGEVVTREELKQTLWAIESQVNHDANLNTTINKLRRALGESTDKVSYIETIPRRGYRFIGAAEFSDLPFVEEKSANSATLEAITPDHERELPERRFFRLGESLTVIMLTVLLAGILLGATAATFWISHGASHVLHSAVSESRLFRWSVC
jgi:DNA-binding winged helix-turn-helix (wHTH) protein